MYEAQSWGLHVLLGLELSTGAFCQFVSVMTEMEDLISQEAALPVKPSSPVRVHSMT